MTVGISPPPNWANQRYPITEVSSAPDSVKLFVPLLTLNDAAGSDEAIFHDS